MPDQITVMGSRLQLKSPRQLIAFLRGTRRINQQVKEAPGLLDSKLRAQFGSLTFWTLSTWEDEASLQAFARSDPHASVIAGLRRSGAMRSADFAFWTIGADEGPPTWGEVERRVAAAISR